VEPRNWSTRDEQMIGQFDGAQENGVSPDAFIAFPFALMTNQRLAENRIFLSRL
jgi:hypothetical protein